VRACRLYALQLPFHAAVGHSAAVRSCSDSVVVRLEGECGTVGYGEAVARPYVTGETARSCMAHIVDRHWPSLRGREVEPGAADAQGWHGDPCEDIPAGRGRPVVAWNAARGAVEVALIDLGLRAACRSLGEVLPPVRSEVRYSGVIPAVAVGTAERLAARYRESGICDIKIKVGDAAGTDRVAAVRSVLGRDACLRADANGAWDSVQAIRELRALEPHGLAFVEQPIPRGDPRKLAQVRRSVQTPIMADESLVTPEDARALIAAGACDGFNLRVAKCGGIAGVLAIAALARDAGVRLQLGCQVGETAILSAVGRHLAAHISDLEHVEGSFGTRLLVEDVAREAVEFGPAGRAALLCGPGLGIEVREDVLARHALTTVELGG
jgi:muconate cycloisomerase